MSRWPAWRSTGRRGAPSPATRILSSREATASFLVWGCQARQRSGVSSQPRVWVKVESISCGDLSHERLKQAIRTLYVLLRRGSNKNGIVSPALYEIKNGSKQIGTIHWHKWILPELFPDKKIWKRRKGEMALTEKRDLERIWRLRGSHEKWKSI